VPLPARQSALFFAAIVFLSAALAAMALWTFSNARTAFDYMVVGTHVTAIGLAAVFAAVVKRRWL
jgi:hypothetical protein